MPETQKEIQEKILENIANPVSAYELDGEKTQMKDPVKQLQALEMLKRQAAAKNPLGAVRTFRIPSGTGER